MGCIICGGEILVMCKCILNDKVCENGHEYHYSPYDKEYHEGKSTHSADNCCKDRVVIKKEDTGEHEV